MTTSKRIPCTKPHASDPMHSTPCTKPMHQTPAQKVNKTLHNYSPAQNPLHRAQYTERHTQKSPEQEDSSQLLRLLPGLFGLLFSLGVTNLAAFPILGAFVPLRTFHLESRLVNLGLFNAVNLARIMNKNKTF